MSGGVPFGDDEAFGLFLFVFVEVDAVDADDFSPLESVLFFSLHICYIS